MLWAETNRFGASGTVCLVRPNPTKKTSRELNPGIKLSVKSSYSQNYSMFSVHWRSYIALIFSWEQKSLNGYDNTKACRSVTSDVLLVEDLKNGVITSGSRSKMAVVMVFVCRFSLVLAVTRFAFCPILQRGVNFVSASRRVDRAWEHRDGFWRDDTRSHRARSIIVVIKTNVELRFRLGWRDTFFGRTNFCPLPHFIGIVDIVQQWQRVDRYFRLANVALYDIFCAMRTVKINFLQKPLGIVLSC